MIKHRAILIVISTDGDAVLGWHGEAALGARAASGLAGRWVAGRVAYQRALCGLSLGKETT